MAIDYEIAYKEGTTIPHANAISRLRFESDTDKLDFIQFSKEIHVVNFTECKAILIVELRTEYDTDDLARRISTRISDEKWTNCSQAESQFKKVREFLTVADGLVYHGTRPYIPNRLRRRVIERAHDTHPGITATQNMTKLVACWPRMTADIKKFVNDCYECSKSRPRESNSVDTWPDAKPWERLHMDWAYSQEVGNILILVDAGSGWIEAFVCGTRPTESVIKCLSSTFARFGIPKTLVSDNAKEFVTEHLVGWLRAQGCTKIESPVYHPRANGIAERAVQTVTRAMKTWNPNLRCSFHAFLQRVLMTHRNKFTARSKTPSEILLGQNVRTPTVIDHNIGEPIFYRTNTKGVAIPATYVVRKGNNTAFVQPTGAEKGILAGTTQIASMPVINKCDQSETTTTAINESNSNETNTQRDMMNDIRETSKEVMRPQSLEQGTERRSGRIRMFPKT